MATILDDEVKIKPTVTTLECEEMLNEALAYIAKNSLKQARIMNKQFYDVLRILQRIPKISTKYKKRMRRIKLGKFCYFIYYREIGLLTRLAYPVPYLGEYLGGGVVKGFFAGGGFGDFAYGEYLLFYLLRKQL